MVVLGDGVRVGCLDVAAAEDLLRGGPRVGVAGGGAAAPGFLFRGVSSRRRHVDRQGAGLLNVGFTLTG